MPFSLFHSFRRLSPPKAFKKQLFRFLKTAPGRKEAACDAAQPLRENAAFLHTRYLGLKREVKACPSLPGNNEGPKILQCARSIAKQLPLEAGPVMRAVRIFYGDAIPLCREVDMLQTAIQCALFERLTQALKALPGIRGEEDALQCHKECALLVQAMHTLPRLPWDAIRERLNPVAQELKNDATYREMDKESRWYYIACACRIAKRYHLPETAVARAALTLTEGKEGTEKEAGYYLIEHPEQIARHLFKPAPSLSFRQKTVRYLLPLVLSAVAFSLIYLFVQAPVYLLPAGLLAFSEHSRCVYYRLLRKRIPPRMLPRLKKSCIAKERLLVVVPTLLTNSKQALQMAHQLQTLHAATPHAAFMLLGDFPDSPQCLTPEDQQMLQTAAAAVDALNQREKGRFFYLHRQRTWDEKQQLYTGRERKRGALEAVNCLLCGEECTDTFIYTSCPLHQLEGAFDAVITLDADTFLPPGAAHKLQGALAHPLQKERVGVIQPRMATLAKDIRTRTQHFFASPGSVDSYHTFVQNVYQDVFGRGSFAGKGIYRPRHFLAHTKDQLPQGQILSHDLIEGELAGAALAEDIACYDTQPAQVSGWQKRLHRWIRGDWQLLPFLANRSLPLLSRWKIYDNLRASLVPFGEMLLLTIGALLQNPFLMLLGLPYPFHGLVSRLIALPGKAFTQLDAALRALHRLFISKKHLLSWVTASQTEGIGGLSLGCVFVFLLSGLWMLSFSLLPGGVLVGLIPGSLWLVAPLFVSFMNQPRRTLPLLTGDEKESVLSLCRDTWHFFEKNVHSRTFYLPPDNVQLQPEKGPAMRTSPTNIGLYLLSVLAAGELQFITALQMARRMLHTVETLEKMEKWQGHLFNWYDLNTLQPLPPRFVSTVDSGNLCACLLTCAQGARTHLKEMGDIYWTLPERMDRLARGMQFARLYDTGVSLFRIGYDADAQTLTPSHYDLLASECRLTSYTAIMLRQVPMKHWFALGRNTVRQGGSAALLSWGGTAFEYLMPQLMLPLYPNTLLHSGCLSAIRAQIACAGQRPFGISESGYFAFDPDMQYQYRAFGLPGLATSGHTGGHVIAPYASMLALPFFPKAAIRNLQWMRRLSWYSEDGLFEAADYTPARLEQTPRLVESHMAHHQGMILCAACNLLTDFALVRHFMTPAPARAYSFLLCEGKPPLPPYAAELPALPGSHTHPETFSFPASSAAHALSGHGVTWLLDTSGSGILKSGSRLWTRFFPKESCGPQFYLRNVQTGACIRPQGMGDMLFENGSVRIPIRAFHLSGDMRFFVLPLNGTAVMDLQLTNQHPMEQQIEVISFLELARSSYAEDAAHPHFRDLSVMVEPWGQDGLTGHTLSSSPQPLVVHRLLGPVQALHRQGDRLLFLGRNGTYETPEQTTLPAARCQFRTGAVIAPCLSLRGMCTLAPGQTIHLQFITFEAALAADIPSDDALLPHAALALSSRKAAMTLRFLSVSGDHMPLYCRLLHLMCFAPFPKPAAPDAGDIHTLYRYGLSGHHPLCTVYLTDADKPLIRHLMDAHGLFETNGAETALLFVCDEGEENYHTPLMDTVHALLSTHSGSRERIYIFAGTARDALALRPLSRVFLESGQPLAQQLSYEPPSFARPVISLPPAPPPPALTCPGACGGFTQEGDYCIHTQPPAPWHQLLVGQRFGTLVCENAVLHSFCDNSHLNRITKTAADVHRPTGAESYTLAAENTRYSLSAGLVYYRPGIAEYHTLPFGLKARLTVFSHPALPAGLRLITLQGEQEGTYTLTCALHFDMGTSTVISSKNHMLLASGSHQGGCAFAFMPDAEPDAVHPEESAFSPSTGIFRCTVHLNKHQSRSLPLILGYARGEEEAVCTCAAILQQGAAGCLRSTQLFWQEKLDHLQLFGCPSWLQLYMNRWLPYQTLAARLLGRTGPYQQGGAFGFRDQLQDLLCCLHTQPETAREHLLLCAAHQYPEGDVQHWWHPPMTGVRTRISDDKLFLPYITALYVQITGDHAILSRQASFLHSPPLKENEHDRYEIPEESLHTASLFDHCMLALSSVSLGPRQLPLMGSGDWNDGMDRVEGESVWLGFFLCMVYQQFAPLCPPETAEKLLQKRTALLQALESAWTGQWYLRAWYKNGEPLAGPDTHPPRIDLITQAFACLAGAPREHARKSLAWALQKLYREEDGMVLLLDPPFTPLEQAGYIGHYVPGVRENGGQYTHAVPWLIMALCEMGETKKAWQIARDILPLFHTDTEENLRRYRLEPYVLCGDVYAGENRGRGGWSWYTGSAAWLYYGILTKLLGFEKRADKVRLRPVPMPDAEEFTLVYRFGTATYHLTASPDILFATLDGEKIQDSWASLLDDGRTHEARFPYRKI